MDLAAYKKNLQRKEQELQADIARQEAEVRDDARQEARDQMDQVVSSEDSEKEFQQAGSDSRVLIQVREALARIEKGVYGRCIDCGRRIEPSRLAAIPWTPYCLDDQQRHDRSAGPLNEPTL